MEGQQRYLDFHSTSLSFRQGPASIMRRPFVHTASVYRVGAHRWKVLVNLVTQRFQGVLAYWVIYGTVIEGVTNLKVPGHVRTKHLACFLSGDYDHGINPARGRRNSRLENELAGLTALAPIEKDVRYIFEHRFSQAGRFPAQGRAVAVA